MTFVVEGDEDTIEQCTKQLNKLIDVIKVSELKDDEVVARELVMFKVHATPSTRSEIIQLVEIFRADIVDVSHNSLIIEATGDDDKISSLYNLLRPFGIREVVRTGRIAISRSGGDGWEERVRVQTNGTGENETSE